MAISITSKIAMPKANPIKFRRVYSSNETKNPDDRAFLDTIRYGGLSQDFKQLWKKTDTPVIQLYSGFDTHVCEVLDLENACNFSDVVAYTPEDTLSVSQAKQYLQLEYFADCKAKTYGTKLAIYFEDGFSYTDNTFGTQVNEINFNGDLPGIAKVDDFVGADVVVTIIFSGGGTNQVPGTVTEVAFDPDSEAILLVTDYEYGSLSSQDAQVALTYDEKPFNLYAFTTDFSGLADGVWYIGLKFIIGTQEIRYISEPQDVYTTIPATKPHTLVEYKNSGDYAPADETGYFYDDVYLNPIRIEGDFIDTNPAGEIDTFENERSTDKLRAVSYTEIEIYFSLISGYQLRNILNVLEHDTLKINEYFWNNTDFGDKDSIDLTDLQEYRVKLRQVNDNRFGTTEVTEIINASFVPTEDSFISDGESQDFVFSADILTNFTLESKPSWISVDLSTINDGDTVQATATENTGSTERVGSVVYKSTQYPDLTASFGVTQAAPASGGDFLNVSTNLIEIDYEAQIILVNVNASGPWSIDTVIFPTGFNAVQVTSTLLRITSSDNFTAIIMGTITISLDSNPGITQDIDVSQTPVPSVTEWSPVSMGIGTPGGTLTPDLVTDDDCTWQIQVSAGATWVHPAFSAGTGSKIPFNITVDPNLGGSRSAIVTAKNSLYSPNVKTFTINQEGNE